jgi:hypothetical protein
MKEGYIEGCIISNIQVKCILEDYCKFLEQQQQQQQHQHQHQHQQIEDKKKEHQQQELIELNQLNLSSTTSGAAATSPMSASSTLENFRDYFVFDYESEYYVTLNEAFCRGIVISEPIRIIDPCSGNYILLRNAVIKGLVSCEPSRIKVEFKKRSSFFTFNRVSYIIDRIYDFDKKNFYSLQEATKICIFKNGLFKINDCDWLPIEQAIAAGYIIGKKVDLEEIDVLFRTVLTVPPLKPSRGIFVESSQSSPESLAKTLSSSTSSEKQVQLKQHKQQEDFSELTCDNIKFIMDYSLTKKNSGSSFFNSNYEQLNCGRVELVKDLKSGRFLKLNEAISSRIINFAEGYFLDTLEKRKIDITSAIDLGYIVLDYHAANFVGKKKQRSRSLSQNPNNFATSMLQNSSSGDGSAIGTNDLLNENELIKVGRQFVITAVLDTVSRVRIKN